jgi:hypothetical protein
MAKKVSKPAPVAAAPSGNGATASVDRNATPFCVFIGKSPKPQHWAKSQDEIVAYLNTVAPKKLKDVHIATVKPATIKISVTA